MSIGVRKAGNWAEAVTQRNPKMEARWGELYGGVEDVIETRRPLYERALGAFVEQFGNDRDVLISRAPGRINLLGNHIEHRGGTVNYMAINRETLLVASARDDDQIVLHNANPERFPARRLGIGELFPLEKRGDWLSYIDNLDIAPGDWGNYIAAAVLALQNRVGNLALKGMDLVVAGDIPIGAGLSSSSSLVVSALEAMLAYNQIEIPEEEKAIFCGEAEWYVGTRGGAGDHAAMLHARSQAVLRLQFFPLTTEEIPFPENFRVVACNSFVEHQSRSIFNERIATYEIGLMLVKQAFPQTADRLPHLRDLNAAHLDVSEADIYRMLQSLPDRMARDEIRKALPDDAKRLDTLFAPHEEPEGGYRVRQVILYGLAECARGDRCGDLLKANEIDEVGRLKYLSHDGDRSVRYPSGLGETATEPAPEPAAEPVDNRISDERLESLIGDLMSGDATRIETARIYNQSGGYDCSCAELDLLVDLACGVPGVAGAGLAGGGLGGCVLVLVEEAAVRSLSQVLDSRYYAPRGLTDGMLVCASVAGSGIV